MKIVIATPLFPPDIAAPAPYTKELAGRLTKHHEVTLVIYGRLPEHVDGVRFVCVDKRASRPTRLLRFATTLWRAARNADVLIVENGPSVELPFILIRPFVRARTLLHIGDPSTYDEAHMTWLKKALHKLARTSAQHVVDSSPYVHPEILPFSPHPTEALAAYEASWKKHETLLYSLFV